MAGAWRHVGEQIIFEQLYGAVVETTPGSRDVVSAARERKAAKIARSGLEIVLGHPAYAGCLPAKVAKGLRKAAESECRAAEARCAAARAFYELEGAVAQAIAKAEGRTRRPSGLTWKRPLASGRHPDSDQLVYVDVKSHKFPGFYVCTSRAAPGRVLLLDEEKLEALEGVDFRGGYADAAVLSRFRADCPSVKKLYQAGEGGFSTGRFEGLEDEAKRVRRRGRRR